MCLKSFINNLSHNLKYKESSLLHLKRIIEALWELCFDDSVLPTLTVSLNRINWMFYQLYQIRMYCKLQYVRLRSFFFQGCSESLEVDGRLNVQISVLLNVLQKGNRGWHFDTMILGWWLAHLAGLCAASPGAEADPGPRSQFLWTKETRGKSSWRSGYKALQVIDCTNKMFEILVRSCVHSLDFTFALTGA